MAYKKQRIRDPLYNLIEFRADELDNILWEVIQTRDFQRLRRIKQLGFSEFVYPGATHTRFSHSIGTFHIARRLLEIIKRESDEFKLNSMQATLAASLLHDLGHGPFSHAFEEVGKRRNIKAIDHEYISNKLIREGEIADILNKLHSGFSNDVARVIGDQDDIYSAIVSGGFDADRLDYMQRDRLMTGTYLGTVDLEWLLSNLEVGKVEFALENDETPSTRETLVLNQKGIYASEAYIMNLFHLYPSVYFHKTTRCMEKFFTELMVCIMEKVEAGDHASINLPKDHCLIRFAENPDDIENILALDDTIIWGAIDQLKKSQDKNISNLSIRLIDRKIFRCIKNDIKYDLLQGISISEEKTKLKAVFADMRKQVEEWNHSQPDCNNWILFDELNRAPYKLALESKKASDRIWLNNNGRIDLLERHSSFLRFVDPIWTARAYVSKADNKAARFFDKILADGREKLL